MVFTLKRKQSLLNYKLDTRHVIKVYKIRVEMNEEHTCSRMKRSINSKRVQKKTRSTGRFERNSIQRGGSTRCTLYNI